MDKRHYRIRYYLYCALCVIALAGTANAQQIKAGDLIELKRDSARVGRFHATEIAFDSLAYRNTQLQRLLDSISGVDQRDMEHVFYGSRNFVENTADTLWLQTGINTSIYTNALTLNSRLDRFVLQTEWSGGQSAYGPSSITALPAISSDSALVYAICRLNTQPGGAYKFLIFKRPKGSGITGGRVATGGNTFVISETIDNTHFADSTSNQTTFIYGRTRVKFP